MNWLDAALDDATRYLEEAEVSLFEIDYASEGIRLLRENSALIEGLGKESFAKTMVLRAAGSNEEARQIVLNAASWEARKTLREAARDDLRQEGESDIAWSILGDIAVTMIRAVLPFILAAVI